jgi:hypothetical protein
VHSEWDDVRDSELHDDRHSPIDDPRHDDRHSRMDNGRHNSGHDDGDIQGRISRPNWLPK